LLVLADGYSDNNFRVEKEVIFKHHELEINFQITENHLHQNNKTETRILSLYQTRYMMQLQQSSQNILKINLSKSEYDSIELHSSLNSIKNNPWLMNTVRDGFRFFETNNYDLVSISSNNSNDSLASKEFYKSYQNGQKETFVCVIGDSAFNCNSWESKR